MVKSALLPEVRYPLLHLLEGLRSGRRTNTEGHDFIKQSKRRKATFNAEKRECLLILGLWSLAHRLVD